MTLRIQLLLLPALILILAACGSSAPSEPASTAQEISSDDVLATVVSTVEDQINQWQAGQNDGQGSDEQSSLEDV